MKCIKYFGSTLLILQVLAFGLNHLQAQDPSAIVEFESTKQGVLIPRMLESERNLIANPATGLLVYQIDGEAGFYFNYGIPAMPEWRLLGSNSNTPDPVWTEQSDKIFAGDSTQVILYGDNTFGYNRNRTKLEELFYHYTPNMAYNPANGATRFVGYSENDSIRNADQLDTLGSFSFASGFSTDAFGVASFSTGSDNSAIGKSSATLGGNYNKAHGINTAIVGGSSNFTTPNRGNSFIGGGGGNRTYNYSSAILGGYTGHAHGNASVILGGQNVLTHDAFEVALGRFNTQASGDSLFFANSNRMFAIGNGTNLERSNALEVFGDGKITVNEEYSFPTTDGTAGQVLQTDGSGNLEWDSLSLYTDLGIGTDNPVSEVHIKGEDENATLTISPNQSNSNDSASVFFAEDDDGTYGMSILYDGVGNDMKIYGKSGDNIYGPHLVIDRGGTGTQVGIGAIVGDYNFNVEGNTRVSGYTKLGSDAPKIKIKKLTGITPQLQGGVEILSHSLDVNKILSVTVLVESDSGSWYPPGFEGSNNLEYYFHVSSSSITIHLSLSNSSNLTGNDFKVLITYEE